MQTSMEQPLAYEVAHIGCERGEHERPEADAYSSAALMGFLGVLIFALGDDAVCLNGKGRPNTDGHMQEPAALREHC